MKSRAALALMLSSSIYCSPPAETWTASWYGKSHAGRRTASGRRFDPSRMVCAHRSLPFGTILKITYQGRSVLVEVIDRGPAAWTGRALDLSHAAAHALGFVQAGVVRVQVEAIGAK